jgi:DNA-binding transcriptional LysR family regulator
MLDARRLVVLREFAAQGTIAKAAARLSFTPSAVSQQLAQLQREAGVELFTHEGRRLELTDAGRLLVERADSLLSSLEEVEAELAQRAGVLEATVRVAAFQTAARFLVLPALDKLGATHPGLRVELLELEAETSLPALERGALDVVVAEEYPNAPRPRSRSIDRRDLMRDEMKVALASGGRRKLRLSSLASAEWVTANEGTAYAEMTVGVCRTVGGFEPSIRHRANDLQLMLDLVAEQGCAAIVPSLGGAPARPLAEGAVARTIFVSSRKSDRARPSTCAVIEAIGRAAFRP